MKRLIIAILLCIITFSINAQEIKFRRILEPDGLSVMTNPERISGVHIFTGKFGMKGDYSIAYALQFEQSSNENENCGYSLHIYLSLERGIYIPKGGKVLIRTTKDEVLNLQDCGTDEIIEYSSTFNSREKTRAINYYSQIEGKDKTLAHGKYVISEDELQTLMNDGVIKIRIETTSEPIQLEYKPGKTNKTASVIQKLYNVLIRNIDLYYGL